MRVSPAGRPGYPTPRRQDREYDGHDQERRYVAGEMTVLLAVDEALDGHDAAMNEARPDREPDQARVRRRVLRRDDEKHPERGVDADDHHQIVGGNERRRSRHAAPHPA